MKSNKSQNEVKMDKGKSVYDSRLQENIPTKNDREERLTTNSRNYRPRTTVVPLERNAMSMNHLSD